MSPPLEDGEEETSKITVKLALLTLEGEIVCFKAKLRPKCGCLAIVKLARRDRNEWELMRRHVDCALYNVDVTCQPGWHSHD